MIEEVIRPLIEPSISFGLDWDESKAIAMLKELNLAQNSLDLLFKGNISVDDYFERLATCEHIDIDSYIDLVEKNLFLVGLCD
jgi:hypothetical protein